ncbi:hypothetical protein HYX13_05675 [Candidatus Woesearchaeota archaeon]|nr:hypothetical protein [Candidatus Woesearchaeota archaeon]
MSKFLTSLLVAGSLAFGMPVRAESDFTTPFATSASNEISKEKNIETENLEQKIDSWFAPRDNQPKKQRNGKKEKRNTTAPASERRPERFQESFNPYKYNFNRFGHFYPFFTSGLFPQQYFAGGTLVAVPHWLNYVSGTLRLQVQGMSSYLDTQEFDPEFTPNAEFTLVLSSPETRRNSLVYYFHDTNTISLQKKMLETSNFYSHTPGLLLRFRAEDPPGENSSYHAQAILSYEGWFAGGRYLQQNTIPAWVFLFGRENLYAAVVGIPTVRGMNYGYTIVGKLGMFRCSVQGQLDSEGWKVRLNMVGSSIEADLLGK